jgi:hypothetical protein
VGLNSRATFRLFSALVIQKVGQRPSKTAAVLRFRIRGLKTVSTSQHNGWGPATVPLEDFGCPCAHGATLRTVTHSSSESRGSRGAIHRLRDSRRISPSFLTRDVGRGKTRKQGIDRVSLSPLISAYSIWSFEDEWERRE